MHVGAQNSAKSARWIAVAAAVVCWAVLLAYYHAKFGLNVPPSATGDEPSYDSLGWELVHGRGYRLDYGNDAFRRPYDLAAQANPELFTLPGNPSGPIAFRPPLFPLVIAATDFCCGRQFWAIRMINAAAIAVLCGLLVWQLRRRLGLAAACCGFVLFIGVDFRTRLFGRAILTEAFAALLFALLYLSLNRYRARKSRGALLASGLLTGLAVLNRSLFVLWVPLLLIVIAFLSFDAQADASEPAARKRWNWRPAGLWLAVVLAVVAPWGVRNLLVLNRFMPMGTQGMMELAAGYSDVAWKNRGIWTNLSSQGFFDGVTNDNMTSLERELAVADESRRRAIRWIAEHPGKTACLLPLKVAQEFRPRTAPEAVLLALAVFGAIVTWSSAETRLTLTLTAINALSIAATWSVEGRFLVPLLLVEHLLAAAGLWWIICRLSGRPFPAQPISRDDATEPAADVL